MDVLKIVLIVLEVIASLALVLIVLLQSGKEDGLSSVMGSATETYLGKSKAASLDKKLAGATKWVALAWILITLALSLV